MSSKSPLLNTVMFLEGKVEAMLVAASRLRMKCGCNVDMEVQIQGPIGFALRDLRWRRKKKSIPSTTLLLITR